MWRNPRLLDRLVRRVDRARRCDVRYGPGPVRSWSGGEGDRYRARRPGRVRVQGRGMTFDTAVPAERAYLVALEQQGNALEAEDSLDELATLVEAAGGSVVGRATQHR